MARVNWRQCLVVLAILLVSFSIITPLMAAPPAQAPDSVQGLIQKAQSQGTVRIIIGLNVPFQAEGRLVNQAAVQTQRQTISAAQDAVLQRMQAFNLTLVGRFQFIPYMAVEVDAAALAELATLPEITSIEEDVPEPPHLASATQVIGADYAWANGYTGAGQVVAILDTGVDKAHPFFTTVNDKVVSEACYSTTFGPNNSFSVCPGGVSESTAVGSGVDCTAAVAGYPGAIDDCEHGTHVAGIAAGNDEGENIGVARDADVIAIQVFSLFTDTVGMASYPSDQIKGLERVYALRTTFDIAAANMSLGGGEHNTICDGSETARKAAIDNLVSVDIATIISSGNDDFVDATGAPGCISTAVTIGATEDDDDVAAFSNIAPFVDLLAPGVGIVSSVPGGGTESKNGTSMSAPMTTGAWAVMKAITPTATVAELLTIFENTATLVDDNRALGIETDMPRINLDLAINQVVSGLIVNKAAAGYVLPGRTLTYTIGVFNENAVTANNIVITDIVPANTSLGLGSLSGDGGSTGAGPGSLITWNTGSNLLSGQGLTRTFQVTVDSGATNGGTITNEAYASAGNLDETRKGTASTTLNRIAQCDFTDGFEAGVLSDYWSVHTTNDGRVRVTSTLDGIAPHGGSYHAILDDSVFLGDNSEAGIILTLDLIGQTAVDLDFWWVENLDENHAQDGVFISDDYGATWHQVLSFNGGSSTYTNSVIDIDSAASSNGLTLNDHFQIKFQFYDNSPFESGDGYGIDDVQITCTGPQLSISKGVATTNTPALPGETITYTVMASNSGNLDATNVRITDTLPTYVNGTDLDQTTTVTASDQVTYVFTATVDPGVPYGQYITNTAYFSHTSQQAGSDSATFTVIGNQAPLAVDDIYQVDEDNTLTVLTTTGVLTNDSDLDPLTATVQTLPLSGTLALSLDGSFAYTPTQDFNGQDNFVYIASDGALTDTATVTITVIAINDPPTVATPIPDQNALAGSPYTYTVPAGTFTDPDSGDTITLTVSLSGTALLPGWLSFDSLTETFSGTPSVADVGSQSIRVTATDSGALNASDEFTLIVTSGDPEETIYLPVVLK